MSGILHELLAVEPSLKGAAIKILGEAEKTFKDRGTHFHGMVRSYECAKDGDVGFPDESSPLVTTVGEKLAHVAEIVSPWIDAGLQIDRTNLETAATLHIGDVAIENVPATFLLRLDHRLSELRKVFNAIPTLEPKHDWSPDADKGQGVWQAKEERKNRSVKEEGFEIIVKSDEHHPAQYERVMRERHHGVYVSKSWSGELSVSQKYEIMKRLDALQAAVKKALASANRIDHNKDKIAEQVFTFLLGDIPQKR